MRIRAHCTLGAAAFVLAGVSTASAGGCDESTTSRVGIVRAERLPDVVGTPSRGLRLWRVEGGRRIAVPVQVDHCVDGQLVLGLDGGGPPETISADDVIVFQPRDAGGENDDGPEVVHDIVVRDPATGTASHLHVGTAPADGLGEPDDVVDYDYERGWVEAESYSLHFEGAYVDRFHVGARGESKNLVDRLKARARAKFLWGLIAFERTEENVTGKITGYRDGPVRAVMRTRMHVKVGLGLPAPEILSDTYFYGEHAEAPISINLPFSLGYVFGDLDVRVYMDFLDLDGWAIESAGIRPGELRVGAMPPEPPAPETLWLGLTGPASTLLLQLRLAPSLRDVSTHLHLRESGEPDPPERVPGYHPAMGFRLTNWSSVGRGRHVIWMDTFVIPTDGNPSARSVLDEATRPLHLEIDPS